MSADWKVLRRLDDGRIVFRLNALARPVILTLDEYEAIKALMFPRALNGAAFGVSLMALFFLTRLQILPLSIAIAIGVILAAGSHLLDTPYRRRLRAIMDAAPVESLVERRPSIIEAGSELLRHLLVTALRGGRLGTVIFVCGAMIVYCGLGLFGKVVEIGIHPNMDTSKMALTLGISAICLPFLLAERRRRKRAAKAGG